MPSQSMNLLETGEEHLACAGNPSVVFPLHNNKSGALGPGSQVYKASVVRVSTPEGALIIILGQHRCSL